MSGRAIFPDRVKDAQGIGARNNPGRRGSATLIPFLVISCHNPLANPFLLVLPSFPDSSPLAKLPSGLFAEPSKDQ